MNAAQLSSFGLRAHLAVRRFGWANAVACTFAVAACGAALWSVPHARQAVASRKSELDRTTLELAKATAAGVPAPTVNEERLSAFYRTLGEAGYEEQQVKTLFAIAAKVNLSLDQAEYRSGVDKIGKFSTYQIALPVKGSYSAIRQFCEQVLLALPFASLDQIEFKREAIASNAVEAKLRLTLYLAQVSSERPKHRERPEAAE